MGTSQHGFFVFFMIILIGLMWFTAYNMNEELMIEPNRPLIIAESISVVSFPTGAAFYVFNMYNTPINAYLEVECDGKPLNIKYETQTIKPEEDKRLQVLILEKLGQGIHECTIKVKNYAERDFKITVG